MNQSTKVLCGILLGSVALLMQETTAEAQAYNPARRIVQDQTFRRPTVSPYLNLLREDGRGLPTYQTLVRPQIQQRRSSQQQTQQIQQLQSQVAQNSAASQAGGLAIRPTGHTTLFRNFGRYYPRLSQR